LPLLVPLVSFLIPSSNIRILPKRHLIHRLIEGAISAENFMDNFSTASLNETRVKEKGEIP
jgi:hypothetical protein